jgi:hypothetical protein
MTANLESVEQAILKWKSQKMVSCPSIPMAIPGSDSATALESGDTIGNCFSLRVPPSGQIVSATLYDFDAEGSQVDVFVFKEKIADVAVDAAYAPTDVEGLTFLTLLSFVSFTDQGAYKTSEINNIGKGYSVPCGFRLSPGLLPR